MKISPEAKRYLKQRRSELVEERESWRAHWKDLQDYILPWNGYALDGSTNNERDGDKRNDLIINDTATAAARVLAAGMQSGITSPARPWFQLLPEDPGLVRFRPVADWLKTVEQILYFIFSRSNVYNALHRAYKELGVFCTAAISVERSFRRVIHCRPFSIGSYAMDEDPDGDVNEFFREYAKTAQNIVDEFGRENCSDVVLQAYDNGKRSQTFDVCHLIAPRSKRLVLGDALNRPFVSVYWEKGGNEEDALAVRGFDNFPVLAARWDKVENRVYGDGPGMQVLGDVKMLQVMEEKKLIALAKLAEPPMRAGGEFKDDVIATVPDGITYTDSPDQVGPLYQVNPDFRSIEYSIEKVEMRIRRGFFNDLFLMIANSPDVERTATEIAARQEEKMLMIGPILEQLHSGWLNNLIDRTFSLAWEAGIIPTPPPEIAGGDVRVDYVSVLAQAQKMVGANQVEQFMVSIGNLAGVFPSVVDKVDPDVFVDHYGTLRHTPPGLVKDTRAVEAERQARAQQQQAAEGMAAAQSAAATAKDLSQADMTGDTALARLATGGQQ